MSSNSEAFKEAVGRRLALLREALGLDQTEFGRPIGMSQSKCSNYETGFRLLPPEIATEICKAYNVTTDWLYRGDPGALPMNLWQKIREHQR